MNKRKRSILIIGGAVLILAGLVVGGLFKFGLLPFQGGGLQSGNLYQDPQGRFSMQVDPSWEQVETDGSYTQFKVPDPPMDLYMLVLDTRPIEDAFSQAVEMLGFDPDALEGGAIAGVGDWQALTNQDSAGLAYGFARQIVGEHDYILAVKIHKPGVGVDNAAIMGVMTSLKISGKEEIVIESYDDLEAVVQKQVDSLAGSVSVAVLHKDKIVYTYAYGQANPAEGIPADTQTIYRFGSMTKPFTASALMQLVEQGRVDLDTWPGEYIPEFPESWHVTVRQLLNHSACLPDNLRLTDGLIVKPGESFAPLEEIFSAYVNDYPDQVCEPGKVSNYSNPHYLALARIIEEVSGEPYETYVVDHILTPLGMESTHFQVVEADERYAKGQFPAAQTDQLVAQLNEFRGPGHEVLILQKGEAFSTLDDFRVLPPWGGLFGTPSDITHFLQMNMSGGRYGDIQVLQPDTVLAMQETQPSSDGSPLAFCLSWQIGEDEFGEFYQHSGGGHTIETGMRFYPDLDLGVVVMGSVNGYQMEKIVAGLVNAWTHEK